MITAQEVAAWLGSPIADEHLTHVTEAVNTYVDSLPSIDRNESNEWAQTTVLGAKMLAARLYKRRNSPNGVEAFNEVGATYVSRYDSDIARMLHIEAFRKPRVG
ncbi:hypothetical protein [Rothia sp. ZJ1223]|uniref:hypothetical protein n=1 Tax=Rothia sp. ZJ1223 TaxID=2811098 RepID=UPI0019597CA6|nr:hypothetical protein [Rothia sp. ZJ1223]MBM7052221.1 hypothetical protein [Rothia sp. ZJ1223]